MCGCIQTPYELSTKNGNNESFHYRYTMAHKKKRDKHIWNVERCLTAQANRASLLYASLRAEYRIQWEMCKLPHTTNESTHELELLDVRYILVVIQTV